MTSTPYRRATSLQYWLVALLVAVAGIGLLLLAELDWFQEQPLWATLLNQFGGVVIASVSLALLWDLLGRRSFLLEVLEILKLKTDVESAGLEAIGTDYGKVFEWESGIRRAKNVDVFAAWATTWRNNHQAGLTAVASRENAKIRVCIPDPNDDECVKMHSIRFNMDEERVKNKLTEAIDGYKSLDSGIGSGRVEVYVSRVFRAFTAYRIDDHFIVTLYHHKDSRSAGVPAMTCREGGSLYDFFLDDLEGVLNASTRIYP